MFSKKKKLWILFTSFIKISILGVGGGLTMLPIIEEYFVKEYKLITNEDLIDYIAITQSMPGLIATNISSIVGMKVGGVLGAMVATLGMVIPPFFIISGIVIVLGQIGESAILDKIFMGVRAGVAALILVAALKMGKKIFVGAYAKTLAIVAFILLCFTNVDVILVIIIGAILGIALTFFNVLKFEKGKVL